MTTANPQQSTSEWPLYVLAGGQSSRFGADKALARLDDVPLIFHAIAPFQEIVSATIAVVDRPDRLAPLRLPFVLDRQPLQGPTQGLLAALRHRGHGWLWLAACDQVGLHDAQLRELAREALPGRRAVAWRDSRWQPLPSLWHTDALPVVEAAMQSGTTSLWALLDAVDARAEPLPAGWPLVRRVNTQADLAALQRERHVVRVRDVLQVRDGHADSTLDALAIEAPLQMQLRRGDLTRNLGITLRTPGDDLALTVGLAFSEAAIAGPGDLAHCEALAEAVTLYLTDAAPAPVEEHPRVRLTSAACGACGKAELDVLDVPSQVASTELRVPLALLQTLPDALRTRQVAFDLTGGLHAAGLFLADGTLLDVREDVGRHNAVDKLIGAALLAGRLPLHAHILVLSGRVAFELVQKAALAGLPVIVAVGAPSSLAVEVAERAGITLLGFVRPGRANVYAHPERVVFEGDATRAP